jgi:glycosyltransferase involved in cell wall biosynthesis
MKIGFLAERLLQGFGVDLVIHNQANRLVDLGHDVTVYVQRTDSTFSEQKYKVVLIDSPLLFNPIKTEYKLLRRKLKFFRKEDREIWIVQTWPFYVLIPFLKGKVIVIDHGTSSTQGMYLKRKLVFWYQKYSSRLFYFAFANKILPISNWLKKSIPFYLRWKAKTVYNGADHYTSGYIRNDESISKLKIDLNITNTDTVMLYVGRLNHGEQPYKGVADLIEIYSKAKQQVPNLKLIMAGFGSESDVEYLRNLRVIPIANAPQDKLLQLFDICNFYVSASKWEGFNLPMIEAQSFGKIPIIYNIGPHKEILNSGEDSFVVDTQDEFIEKVIFLSNNEEFRKTKSEKAKLNAAKYTWDRNVEEIDKVISKL